MDQGTPAEILSRLGTVKNPVLFTSGSFSSAMLWFGRDLVQNQNLLPAVTGAAMVVFSLFVFLCGIGFYAYAFLRLPSTAQERMFLQEARVAIDHHDAAVVRNRRGRASAARPTADITPP